MEINHVRSKALALFIKNLIDETRTNIYLDAVVRKYCKDESIIPVPVKPVYMDKRLIMNIKCVLHNVQTLTTRNIYAILLKKELDITEEFQLRIESIYTDFSLESAFQFTYSKMISLPVRSHMWKLIHRIEYSEIEEARVKLTNPS